MEFFPGIVFIDSHFQYLNFSELAEFSVNTQDQHIPQPLAVICHNNVTPTIAPTN